MGKMIYRQADTPPCSDWLDAGGTHYFYSIFMYSSYRDWDRFYFVHSSDILLEQPKYEENFDKYYNICFGAWQAGFVFKNYDPNIYSPSVLIPYAYDSIIKELAGNKWLLYHLFPLKSRWDRYTKTHSLWWVWGFPSRWH